MRNNRRVPTDHPLHSDNAYQRILHHRYHGDRRRIVGALVTAAHAHIQEQDLDTPHPAQRLANKLMSCGHAAVVATNADTQEVRIEQARCRSRLCPLCAHLRAKELETAVLAALPRLDAPGFLTLTLKSSDRPLSVQITDLIASARRLRQRTAWKRHVRGGLAVLEITWSTQREQWHPHLHILCDLRYWPQRAISREWAAASGGSTIVHVKRIASSRAIAKYVAKYCSKGSDARDIPSKHVAEYAQALHGRRLAQTFGSLHGQRMSTPKPASTGTWTIAAYVAALVESAKAGSAPASEILRLLRSPLPGPTRPVIDPLLYKWRVETGQVPAPIEIRPPPPDPQTKLFPTTYHEKIYGDF